MKLSELAATMADEIVGLIGKDNALAERQKLSSQIRAIGAAQDKALSKCRMAVRRLKQHSLVIAEEYPQNPDLAEKIEDLVKEIFQKN